ncbi:MAG: hypothetical protein JWO64_1245 [Hyphomicrobiales bacterium]|nr:hypothetical protein [Hyphomicrobiales bacterium]
MSADMPDDQTNSSLLPDMRALDAALREVLKTAPHEPQPTPQEHNESPLALDQTMDVVSRAATIIDELVERNRSITNAAVRSVEFFRAQATEARAEADRLREELRVLKEQSDAQRIAALAQAREFEAELASRTADLGKAEVWIGEIRSQVEALLGDAETRLSETADESIFKA